jgi:hypothetical protein
MKHAQRPLTHILAMKDWNAAKRKWIGTICQAVRYEDGTEGIVVLDVMSAKTEEALDEELHLSMVLRPWLKDAEQFAVKPCDPLRHLIILPPACVCIPP